ncbi:hypothetical protein BDR05DRAFT_502956 [Suillus weaverae]|nr:hypothetical protein BDR05DRAFT_502956 [Suillus weaverae]
MGYLTRRSSRLGTEPPMCPSCSQPGESDSMTLLGLYIPWHHTVITFAPGPTDASSILAALEPYDKYVVWSAVILPSSAPAAPVTSPADFVLLDQGAVSVPTLTFLIISGLPQARHLCN